jgi:hypothetical protein
MFNENLLLFCSHGSNCRLGTNMNVCIYDKHHNKTDEELFQVSIISCLYEVFNFMSVRPNQPTCMTMVTA